MLLVSMVLKKKNKIKNLFIKLSLFLLLCGLLVVVLEEDKMIIKLSANLMVSLNLYPRLNSLKVESALIISGMLKKINGIVGHLKFLSMNTLTNQSSAKYLYLLSIPPD